MYLSSIASVFVLFTGLVSSIVVPELPFDGLWITKDLGDGTTITTSLSSPDYPAIISDATTSANSLESRNALERRWADGDCWNEQLDVSGVDNAVNAWAGFLGNGGYDLCSGDGSLSVQFSSEGMIVYYCIIARNRCGNLDMTDLRYALGQMDAHCPRYTGSWFRWPGSFEIVGKAKEGDNVCVL